MDSFFPSEDYKTPVNAGAYLKLEDGDNTFRILGPMVVGWTYWTKDNKPVRLKEQPLTPPSDIRIDDKSGKPDRVKHFWAFPIYNFAAKRVQIAEITQGTIQAALEAVIKNPKWGSPDGYDITITRSGQGFDTEYTVMPNPHSAIDEKIVAAFKALDLDLELLFVGGDPFGRSDEEVAAAADAGRA